MKIKIVHVLLCVFALTVATSSFILDGLFTYPYSKANADITALSGPARKLPVEKYLLFDITGIVLGVRRLTANMAWIHVLQYYGSADLSDSEKKQPEETRWHACDHEHKHVPCNHAHGDSGHHNHKHGSLYGAGKYYDLLKFCQRVVRLDPFFHYVYLYGSASMAWNLERPDEGLSLLQEGIENYPSTRPDYWQLHLFKLAIIYKKLDRYADMVSHLESAVQQPGRPVMVVAILANIYKKTQNYERALALWHDIYNTGDADYREYAAQQIQFLETVTE
ncbi:MAG: tetratricopeptide repeat protein [Elusimicrobiota bacterium]